MADDYIAANNGNANGLLGAPVPDYLEIQELNRALAQAKGMLTRRTNAFRNLLAGQQPYTRQQLVTARGHMVTACENMVAELEQYDELGLHQGHAGYLDG